MTLPGTDVLFGEDTSVEARRVLIDGYRAMSAERKLERVFDLSDTLRQLARHRIEETYGPTLSEREIRLKLASLVLSRDTMIRVFDYDPDRERY